MTLNTLILSFFFFFVFVVFESSTQNVKSKKICNNLLFSVVSVCSETISSPSSSLSSPSSGRHPSTTTTTRDVDYGDNEQEQEAALRLFEVKDIDNDDDDEVKGKEVQMNSKANYNHDSRQVKRQENKKESFKNVVLGEIVFKPLLEAIFNATTAKRKLRRKNKEKKKNKGDRDHDQKLMMMINEKQFDGNEDNEFSVGQPFIGQAFQSSECSTGYYQSPINIETRHLMANISLYLTFTAYHEPIFPLKIHNNGHSVEMTVLNEKNGQSAEQTTQPYVSGPALNNQKFVLHDIHFHWTSSDGQSPSGGQDYHDSDHDSDAAADGSEHSLDGRKFAAEIHFVHFNARYGSYAKAATQRDGIAVLASFIRLLSSHSTEKNNHHQTLTVDRRRSLIRAFERVSRVNATCVLDSPLELRTLLSPDLKVFYRYHGSLTSAPCTESVTWIVFPTPLVLASEQFKQMFGPIERSLPKSLYETRRTGNVRSVQPINGRIVQASYVLRQRSTKTRKL